MEFVGTESFGAIRNTATADNQAQLQSTPPSKTMPENAYSQMTTPVKKAVDEAPGGNYEMTPKQTSPQAKNNRHHARPRQSSKKKEHKSKSIGHYLIGKTIGEGTFGKVKLGTHNLTGEKVAVKILEKHKIVETIDVDRVTREIKILKLARHPNIVQLYEIIETPRQLYLITEYVPGGELFDYIVKNHRLKEEEACKFF